MPPPTRITPPETGWVPTIARTSVDFPEPFGADESNTIAPHQRGRNASQQNTTVDIHSGVLGGDHAIPTTLADIEADGHGVAVGERRAETRKPVETLPPPFRLLAVLPGDVASDVVLFRRDATLLLIELTLLAQTRQRPLLDERLVGAHIRRRCVSLQVQHMIDDRREKCAVMADQQDGRGRAR
jgi:hypothetical protein